jgi:hypothetical protein
VKLAWLGQTLVLCDESLVTLCNFHREVCIFGLKALTVVGGVGARDGAKVGFFVGGVGLCVGESVGRCVGLQVGVKVGAGVGNGTHESFSQTQALLIKAHWFFG